MRTQWFATPFTPLITAGADRSGGNPVLEGLRTPQLKGHLRFWFRLLAAGVLGGEATTPQQAVDRMKEAESLWFGDTHCGKRLTIHTQTTDLGMPHPEVDVRMNAGDGRPAVRQAIIPPSACKPGSEAVPSFYVTLQGASLTGTKIALCCLWATAMLGGVGARTRRGFGSMAILPRDDATRRLAADLGLMYSCSGATLTEIADNYRNGLANVLNVIESAFEEVAPVSHGDMDGDSKQPGNHRPDKASSAAQAVRIPSVTQGVARLLLVGAAPGRMWPDGRTAMDDLRERFYRPYKNDPTVGTNTGPWKKNEVGSPSWLHIQIKPAASGGCYGVVMAFQSARDPLWKAFVSRLSKSGLDSTDVSLPTLGLSRFTSPSD